MPQYNKDIVKALTMIMTLDPDITMDRLAREMAERGFTFSAADWARYVADMRRHGQLPTR